jgi:hypothetical protein
VAAGTDDVAVTLRPGGRLELLVRGPGGEPVAGAFPRVVKVSGATVSVPWLGGRSPSDASGRVELGVPAGALEVEVDAQKGKASLRVDVTEGARLSREVVLEAPRERQAGDARR